MESEKVKEIKKVLEEGQFNTINHHQKEGKPIKISFADILTLINELESENEILRNAKVVYETVDYCYEDLKKAEKRIAELEKENAKYNQKLTTNQWVQEIRKEALKQFAERLKDRLRYTSSTSDVLELSGLVFDGIEVEQSIDKTLKEFIK